MCPNRWSIIHGTVEGRCRRGADIVLNLMPSPFGPSTSAERSALACCCRIFQIRKTQLAACVSCHPPRRRPFRAPSAGSAPFSTSTSPGRRRDCAALVYVVSAAASPCLCIAPCRPRARRTTHSAGRAAARFPRTAGDTRETATSSGGPTTSSWEAASTGIPCCRGPRTRIPMFDARKPPRTPATSGPDS